MSSEDLNEKRSEARLLTRLSSRLKLVSAETSDSSETQLLECVTRDISFAGICLLINEKIPESSRCMLKIEDRHSGIEYNHMCQVSWCREREGSYMIGLHIYEHLCDVAAWKNMVISLLSG